MALIDGSYKAFPEGYDDSGGMTLRDYFAAKALLAVVCQLDVESAEALKEYSGKIADSAYGLADAMLKARNT